MTRRAATAWGETTVVDEVVVPQAVGEKRFACVVELLIAESGERYVRFAYTTDGTARRGPVTLREEDVERLGTALANHAELASALRSLATGEGGSRRKRGR